MKVGTRSVAALVAAVLLLGAALGVTHAKSELQHEVQTLWADARQGDVDAAYRLGRFHESRYWLAQREPEVRGNPADLVLAYALFSMAERSSDRLDVLYGRNATAYRLERILGVEGIAIATAALPEWMRPLSPPSAGTEVVTPPEAGTTSNAETPPPEDSEPPATPETGPSLEPVPGPGPAPDPPDLRVQSGTEVPGPDLDVLLAKGTRYLNAGDLASARGFFELAARRGSGEAAMLVAMTYDPQYLEPLGVVGLRPDAERARTWYARAMELGRILALDQHREGGAP